MLQSFQCYNLIANFHFLFCELFVLIVFVVNKATFEVELLHICVQHV